MMHTNASVGSDQLAGALTQVLTVPIRQLYAVLLRAGFIEVVD